MVFLSGDVGVFEGCGGERDMLIGPKLGKDWEVGLDDDAEFWVAAESWSVGAVDKELLIGGDLDCAVDAGFGSG